MVGDKFSYLKNLIEELSKDDKYSLPVFLLKVQLVEYSLKYLLANHPQRTKESIPTEFIEQATMGQIISKLKELNDPHIEDLIKKAEKFLRLRNRATHHFLTSKVDAESINKILKEEFGTADDIEYEARMLIQALLDLMR